MFFLIFSFFLCVTCVSAKECTTEEIRELKQLAKKVEFSYELSELTDGYDNLFFTTTAYNLNDKIYLYIPTNGSEIHYTKSNEKIGLFSPGIELKIVIYASSKTNCGDEELNSIYIKLPTYNKYFNRKECKDKVKVNICKKWYDTIEIDEKEFLQIIQDLENKDNSSFIEKIKIFFQNYGIYLLGIVVVVTITIIIIKLVESKKRKKIEI